MRPELPDSPPPSIPAAAGLVLAPFPALRYSPGQADDLAAVTSPPYDVIDDRERAALEARSPVNVVRLILPRDDHGPGSRYERAARTLARWRREEVLVRDRLPALYVYEESADGHLQRGLLGAIGLTPPEDEIVLPHENTMAGPVADRLALTAATEANLEPIFLVYGGGGVASAAVRDVDREPAETEFVSDDHVRHRLWRISDPAALAGIAADLLPRRAVIADGHHRYATYLRYQADRHAQGAGPGPWDFGLALLVDIRTSGPQVSAIHRVVNAFPPADAARLAARGFRVQWLDGPLDSALRALAAAGRSGPAFLLGDGDDSAFHLLTDPEPGRLREVLPEGRSAAWRALDVTVAHRFLIEVLWGLRDTEDVVDFEHDARRALVTAGERTGTALLLNPTPVEAVAQVAAAGERMPRKSTLFTPKPRTGLVIRALSDG